MSTFLMLRKDDEPLCPVTLSPPEALPCRHLPPSENFVYPIKTLNLSPINYIDPLKTSVDIFIAYSHNDLIYKDQLKEIHAPVAQFRQVKVWDDRDIEAGREWEAEIKERLYGADVILLLVSPDSLDSDYFYGKEVEVSLQRHAKGEAVVVPVILRPCLWEDTPISILEALPTKAKPVTQWPSQDEAFTDVAKSLGKITKRLLEQSEATAGYRRTTPAIRRRRGGRRPPVYARALGRSPQSVYRRISLVAILV